MTDRTAYASTTVPVIQSLEEIRKMIMAHRGVGFRYTQVPDGLTIEWGWTKGGQNFLAKLPVRFDNSPKPVKNCITATSSSPIGKS